MIFLIREKIQKNAIFKYRFLLKELVIRDLKIKYRRSVLGYLWSLLNPLLMMIVLTIVFSHFFRFDIPNYPVYLLSGQIFYNFFSESTNMAMMSILDGAALIKKVYLPKYIFPLSKVLSTFVTFLFSLVAIFIVMIGTGVDLKISHLLLPFALFYILIFSLGMGMIISVLAVYFRDIVHLYGVILSLWMYLTPIFYPMSIVPEYAEKIIALNPLYYFIELFREIILYGRFPSIELHLICMLCSMLTLIVGIVIFKKNQKNFILYI